MGRHSPAPRTVSEPAIPSFVDSLRALRAALDELRVPWLVIGGLAVIARGVPRFTADVDATFVGDDVPLERVFAVLARHAIEPRLDGAIEFARQQHVLLVRHVMHATMPASCCRWRNPTIW